MITDTIQDYHWFLTAIVCVMSILNSLTDKKYFILRILPIALVVIQFTICFILYPIIYKWENIHAKELWEKHIYNFDKIAFINQLLEDCGFSKSDRKYAYWYILYDDMKKTKGEIRFLFVHFAAHYHLIKMNYHNPCL